MSKEELANVHGVSLEAWEEAEIMFRGDLIAESKIPYVARNIQVIIERHSGIIGGRRDGAIGG